LSACAAFTFQMLFSMPCNESVQIAKLADSAHPADPPLAALCQVESTRCNLLITDSGHNKELPVLLVDPCCLARPRSLILPLPVDRSLVSLLAIINNIGVFCACPGPLWPHQPWGWHPPGQRWAAVGGGQHVFSCQGTLHGRPLRRTGWPWAAGCSAKALSRLLLVCQRSWNLFPEST
jgi:hypothetical protein